MVVAASLKGEAATVVEALPAEETEGYIVE